MKARERAPLQALPEKLQRDRAVAQNVAHAVLLREGNAHPTRLDARDVRPRLWESGRMMQWRVLQKFGLAVAGLAFSAGFAGAGRAQAAPAAKDLVNTMLENERYAAAHKDRFVYLSKERSERTGGHMWTERVVETPVGRVRYLLAEDGAALSGERQQQERTRLAADAADPTDFAKRESAQKDDEARARGMLELIPRGFLLDDLKMVGPDWHMDFRPDPNFSPSGTEEKVLHGMSGWLAIDAKSMRMRHIEGKLPQDVSVAFGLGSVHAGSNFMTTKAPNDGQWRTVRVVSDIRGKALIFKSISKNQDVERTEFKRVDNNLTVAQAVTMAEM